MRVLVVAPDQPGLNARPEIRQIQRLHHISILDGVVLAEDIYNTCRDTKFDIIHFATHSSDEGVALSEGIWFTSEEIAQVARLHETPCVIFNSCFSGKPAAYAVRHGVRYVIFTNIELPETQAWKLMVGLYAALQNGAKGNVLMAFERSDSGDGDYGIGIDVRYVLGLQTAVSQPPSALHPPITHTDLVKYALVMLAATGIVTTLINLLAGKF